MTMLRASDLELLKKVEHLNDKDRAEVLARVRRKQADDVRIWYCSRGRTCNGRPHEGVPYEHARSDQWPPAGIDWDTWFYMSGRGTGKTKSGGNWLRQMSKVTDRIAMIGRRAGDVKLTMVEGASGLIKACEAAGETYNWRRQSMEFEFENGCIAQGFSGEEPESLRGPEHGAGWLDEPCHIDLIEEVWLNYTMGLRAKGVPGGAKTLLTSSPLPVQWTKDRIAEKGQPVLDEMGDPRIDPETGAVERNPKTILVQVPTSVNLHNLDEGYKRRVINPLQGTRKGKQELDAMLLEDVEGALWESEWIKRAKLFRALADRVVVAVDPAGSDARTADLTGIVTCARFGERYGVLADRSGGFTPAGWARAVIDEYDRVSADAVVLERFGGDSATTILRQSKHADGRKFTGKIIEVKARQGKETRAEPISGLYEQGLVDHQEGAMLADLEDELLTWVPGVTKKSPDHLDALVWGLTELSGKQTAAASTGLATGDIIRSVPGMAPGMYRGAQPWKN